MSVVGLYDGDMMLYTHVPFNLELMKLATYYKKKRDIVSIAQELDTDRYSKIIYRKDYYDGNFPSEIMTDPNIESGGCAFSEKYIPLPNGADRLIPDTYIYAPLRNKFATTKGKGELFDVMMRAQHIRLSLDGQHVWKDYKSQLNLTKRSITFIFHDYDIVKIENSYETIRQILDEAPTKLRKYVGFKFPLEIYNIDDLLKWSTFSPMTDFYNIHYHSPFTDADLVQFVQQQKGTSISAQMTYDITCGCETTQDLVERMPRIFLQLVYLRNNRIKMRLKYDRHKFEYMWVRVLDLLVYYYSQTLDMPVKRFKCIKDYDSVYSFAAHLEEERVREAILRKQRDKWITKQDARDIFKFVQKERYDVFKMFYECHKVKLVEGELIYE